MAHIVSRFPLTAEQCRGFKLPPPLEWVDVVFKKCRHPGRLLEKVASKYPDTVIDDYCYACKKKF